MRTSTLLVAGTLAAAVSAQSPPQSCVNVVTQLQTCVPADSTNPDDIASIEVVDCLCGLGSRFDNDIVGCIQDAGANLDQDTLNGLEAFRGYCAANGGGGGGNTGSPTSPPETSGQTSRQTSPPTTSPPTSSPTGGSENCNYIASGLSSCWTNTRVEVFATPVANCLCSGTSFDAAIEGCYSDLVDVSPDDAATVSAFSGFCSRFSAGGFPDDASTTGAPSPTGGSGGMSPTTGRTIQTLDPPQSTSASNGGSNGGNNSGGNGPNSAAGLRVAVFGTALAALLAGAALVL